MQSNNWVLQPLPHPLVPEIETKEGAVGSAQANV